MKISEVCLHYTVHISVKKGANINDIVPIFLLMFKTENYEINVSNLSLSFTLSFHQLSTFRFLSPILFRYLLLLITFSIYPKRKKIETLIVRYRLTSLYTVTHQARSSESKFYNSSRGGLKTPVNLVQY